MATEHKNSTYNLLVINLTLIYCAQNARKYLVQGEILYNSFAGDYDEPHKFTGYERDNESGLDYAHNRYYWSDGGIFTSTDNYTFQKPNISGYAYCDNDPINGRDPDGNFPIADHKNLVRQAFKDNYLIASKQILRGTGVVADVIKMAVGSVHITSLKGLSAVSDAFNTAKSNYATAMAAGKGVDAGVALHTVADFYSHSNYIDLYKQYAEGNNKSMAIEDIPTFSDVLRNDGNQYGDFLNILQDNLVTGEVGAGIGGVLNDEVTKNPNSHRMTNLDKDKSINGGQPYNGQKDANGKTITKHDAAYNTAGRELKGVVEENK